MESAAAKILLLVVGIILAEATRHIVEYVKRITPRVEYSSLSGIPVNAGDKNLCAFRIKITNPSKKKVENVTFHVRASQGALKMEVISKPDGLEYSLVDKDDGIDLTFPYLKHDDEVRLKAQVESKYYASDSLGISVSSPNDIEAKKVPYEQVKEISLFSSLFRMPFVFFSGFVFASIVFSVWAWRVSSQPEQTETKPSVYEMDRRDIVISAASVVGLPHIAELYFTAPDPKYFNEGDIAYSLAAASNKPDEIEKYHRLLSLTLGSAKGMAPESEANLYYSLGRLDLLIADDTSALSDFRNAILKSRPIVEAQTKADAKTRKYLIDRGLL